MAVTVGERLAELIGSRGLTLAEAARRAGMGTQQLRRITIGAVPNPGILTVRRAVEALGSTMAEFFAEGPIGEAGANQANRVANRANPPPSETTTLADQANPPPLTPLPGANQAKAKAGPKGARPEDQVLLMVKKHRRPGRTAKQIAMALRMDETKIAAALDWIDSEAG